ncbi:DNA-directed RNA polymerase, subunit E'' [archaeon]|nr:DNA-directed RNA polymerase, subunit E'' [archaeon]
MVARKVCKSCKGITTKDKANCPICKSTQFTTSFKGRLVITDYKNSEIAKKIGITANGEYAIKIR